MPEYTIALRIIATSQDQALQQAIGQLQKLEKQQLEVINSAGKVGSAWTSAGSAIKSALLTVVGPIASIGGLVALLFKGAQAAIEKQKALRGLRSTVADLGQDVEIASARTRELAQFLEKLEIDATETITAVTRLTQQTGNYEEALSAASLAGDIAARGTMSYGTALNLIQAVMAGRLPRDLAEMGINASSAADALQQLEARNRGLAASLNDEASTIAESKATWNDFWEGVGQGAVMAGAAIIKFAGEAREALSNLPEAGAARWFERQFAAIRGHLTGNWGEYYRLLAEQMVRQEESQDGKAGAAAPPGLGGVKLKVHGGGADTKEMQAAAEAAAAGFTEAQQALDAWTKAWDQALGELAATRGTFAKESMANVAQQLAFERQALDMALARDLAAVKGNAQAEALVKETYRLRWQTTLNKAAEERERLETDQAIKISEAQQLVVDQMERELKLKLQLVDLSADERRAVAEMLARLREETEERAYNILLLRQEQELKGAKPEERAGIEARQAKERVAAAKRVTNAKVEGEQAVRSEAAKTAKWDELATQQQVDLAMAATSQVIGAAQQVFGESKALSIAQAIINTYMAASKALAELGPAGPPVAAALVALGMAQVAKIASTNPDKGGEGGGGRRGDASRGRGFDDPRNDAMLEIGGARWADDAWARISAGWARQFPIAMERASRASNVTTIDRRVINQHTDNSRGGTTIINQTTLWGPAQRTQAVKLARLLDQVEHRRRRSTIGGKKR